MIDAVFRWLVLMVLTAGVTKLILLVIDALHYGLFHAGW